MYTRNCFTCGVVAMAVALMFLTLFAGASTPVAHAAATIAVNNTGGGHSATTCTLRDAITAANTDTATGGCPAGSGADTILLPLSLFTDTIITLTEVDNGTEIETNGLPVIMSDITINGRGAIIQRSSLRGTLAFRIFRVGGPGTLTLNNVTIRNGHTPDGTATSPGGYGGGIANAGTLNITNSAITGNSTGDGAAGSGYDGGIGGGIYNAYTLNVTNSTISGNWTGTGHLYGGHGGGIASNMGIVTITNSTISGNTTGAGTTGGWGGGIYNAAKMTITNSTISGNTTGSGTGSGGDGGGIYNDLGGATECSLSITNSTISGNSAGTPNAWGAGIASSGTLTVTSSTIASNAATGNAGGVYRAGATLLLRNTIVANNAALFYPNCGGTITNGGNNLDSGASCGWDSTSGSMSSMNPLLAPLGNYGGPTQTMALVHGSPAIDGVTWNPLNGSPSTDQRGVARPVGAAHDIGAFEGSVYLVDLPLIRK